MMPAMSRDIRQSDWKLFRELRSVAVDRFCKRVLDDVVRIADEAGRTSHERYLAIYELLRERDGALAELFDNPRRSTALLQLRAIHSHGLLTEDEFARFSPEVRERVTLHERV